MRYKIQLSPQAEIIFALLPRELQKRILLKLDFFESLENPFQFAKKLQGAENLFRFRVGDYRLIFTPKNSKEMIILLVLRIGHRREIYD